MTTSMSKAKLESFRKIKTHTRNALQHYLLVVVVTSLVALVAITRAHAHSGHTNKQAWDVCDDKQVSDSCSYNDHDENIYSGSCQLMSSDMICVRNKPIQKAR